MRAVRMLALTAGLATAAGTLVPVAASAAAPAPSRRSSARRRTVVR